MRSSENGIYIYIPYIPQNGNFSRVDDDKELDFGGHQYPELIDL